MKKKLLALVVALSVAATGIPSLAMAAGDGSKTAKVTYSCSSNDGFKMANAKLTVKSNLAETYFPDAAKEEGNDVTVFDVLVAAHIKQYGDSFKKSPADYMNASVSQSGSYVSMIFKDATGNASYINNEGIMGVSLGTVKNGDVVKSVIYRSSDTNYASKYTYFERESYKAIAGKTITVGLKAIGMDENWNPVVENAPAYTPIALYKKSEKVYRAKFTVDAKSVASLKFTKPGAFYLTAIESGTNTMFAPIAEITVGLDKVKLAKIKSSKRNVSLRWKKVVGAKKYQVYRATKKIGKFKKIATIGKLKFTDKKVKRTTKYFYKVRAYAKSDGKAYKGTFSAVKAVKVK